MVKEQDLKIIRRLSKNWKPEEVAKGVCKSEIADVYFNKEFYEGKRNTKMGKRKVFTLCHDTNKGFYVGQKSEKKGIYDNYMSVRKKDGKWIFG